MLLEPATAETGLSTVLIPLERTANVIDVTALELVERPGSADARRGHGGLRVPTPNDNVTWINATHGFVAAKIRVAHDTEYEDAETFALQLRHHSTLYRDYVLQGPIATNITIVNRSPGEARFASPRFACSSPIGGARSARARRRGVSGDMTATVINSNATTAMFGTDYFLSPRNDVGRSGRHAQGHRRPALDDEVYEVDKVIALRIATVTPTCAARSCSARPS